MTLQVETMREVAFDALAPGMLVQRACGDDVEGPYVIDDVDLAGGWADTAEGRTWFRHDLDASWTYQALQPGPRVHVFDAADVDPPVVALPVVSQGRRLSVAVLVGAVALVLWWWLR